MAVVADPHVGNHARHGGVTENGLNRRGFETTSTLRRATRVAKAAGATVFAVAGDLFHNRRPEPAILRAVQDIFENDGMDDLLVPGNHDMLDDTCSTGNTAMSPIYKQAIVMTEPVSNVTGPFGILTVPFDGRTSMRDHLKKICPDFRMPANRPNVLITHVGVYTQEEAKPWQVEAKDAISSDELFAVMEKVGVQLALVGNYHETREWNRNGRKILQIGTLCPASHGDQGGGVVAFVHENGTLSATAVAGPRFVDISLAGPLQPIPQTEIAAGFTYYGRVVSGKGEIPKELPLGFVALDDARSEESTSPTPFARGVAPPTTPTSAIADYIAAMEVPAGTNRDVVRERALDYLRRAS